MANNRKSGSVTKPQDIPLQMDVWEEELSAAQEIHYFRAEKEYLEITAKMNDLIQSQGGKIIDSGQDVTVIETNGGSASLAILNNIIAAGSQVNKPHQQLQPPQSQPSPSPQPQQQQQQQQQPQPPKLQSVQTVSTQSLMIQGGSVQGQARVNRSIPGPKQAFQTPSGTYQIVMDPRLGLMIGTLPNQQSATAPQVVSTGPVQQSVKPSQPSTTVPSTMPPRGRQNVVPRTTMTLTPVSAPQTASGKVLLPTITAVATGTSSGGVTTYRIKPKSTPTMTGVSASSVPTTASTQGSSSSSTPISVPALAAGASVTTPASSSPVTPPILMPTPGSRPTENNSIGGLSAGNTKQWPPASDDGRTANVPDSREVTFNKMSGKTFPSLVVVARPHLRVKDMLQTHINAERAALDGRVKSVLMYSPTKFTEWLIQQGLVRSEQYCNVHTGSDGPVGLKLGMYSDVSKFPYSGGYVWISECCPHRFVSVFSGSIFEGAPHPPSVLLKLMYHWCCQTNVQNVVQWVKVDNFYVKNFFTNMRSSCISAVHQHYEKLGGKNKKVEVGVISLGTTSQDGKKGQVKVEVLGVMDPESKLIRLRAVEPLQDGERNYKRRFVKILEPLDQWVDKASIILTDFTVDKGTLHSMGFNQVHQATISETPTPSNKLCNQNIMEYLRRIVPRMFQNTLSLLSRQIIQQFLDELVWRERWGPVPSQAFETLIAHLAAQTKLDTGENLLMRLTKIAANPFGQWDYDNWKNNGALSTTPGLFCQPTSIVEQNTTTAPITPTPPAVATLPAAPAVPATANSTFNRLEAGDPKLNCKQRRMAVIPESKSKVWIAPAYYPLNYKLDESLENRMKKAIEKLSSGLSLRKAAEVFNLPKSTLTRKACESGVLKELIRNSVFTEDEEADIEAHFLTLHEKCYPFARWDIRIAAKHYLDSTGRALTRFPGDVWTEQFLSRHLNLRNRLCRNVPSRGTFVDVDPLRDYVRVLGDAVKSVPPENILNFIELSLTADPAKSMTVERRDLRYPVCKRKAKSSASIMVSCTALGEVLPSYLVFESATLVENGPVAGCYSGTRTGWFDERTVQEWLETVVIPWAQSRDGLKVIIGDSLTPIFTVESLDICMDNSISFVSIPCNVTNILCPLEVALFKVFKVQWHLQTREYANRNGEKEIPIQDLPAQVNELLRTVFDLSVSKNLQNAFKSTGIHPFSVQSVRECLQKGSVASSEKLTEDKVLTQARPPFKRKRGTFPVDELPSKRPQNATDVVEVVLDDKENKTSDEKFSEGETMNSSPRLVSLNEYYYGTKKVDQGLIEKEFKTEHLNVRCPLCHEFVHTNLDLMKHLMGHSEEKPKSSELASRIQCRYCLMIFSCEGEMNKHIEEVHKHSTSKMSCLICGENFSHREALIVHMQRTHKQLELPYQCSICLYRCSEQYKLVDHFYEVHGNGEKVQCPFCLKCVAISNIGKKMPANTFFFMHHVRKHQAKLSARKCDRCELWFVHKGILKEHQVRDHQSCKDDPSVVPYRSDNDEDLMIPLPDTGGSSNQNCASADSLASFTTKKFESLRIAGISHELCCAECKFNFMSENHFPGSLSCYSCRYTTCCKRAMTHHISELHIMKAPSRAHHTPVILSEDMYCICGYMSKNGNMLAKHLALCKKSSAYPSAAHAKSASVPVQSASFPPLVTLDEGESKGNNLSEEWSKVISNHKESDESRRDSVQKQMKGGRPPTMLNLLGLVRKSSTEREQAKSAPADDALSRTNCENDSDENTLKSGGKRSALEAGLDTVNSCEVQDDEMSMSKEECDGDNGAHQEAVLDITLSSASDSAKAQLEADVETVKRGPDDCESTGSAKFEGNCEDQEPDRETRMDPALTDTDASSCKQQEDILHTSCAQNSFRSEGMNKITAVEDENESAGSVGNMYSHSVNVPATPVAPITLPLECKAVESLADLSNPSHSGQTVSYVTGDQPAPSSVVSSPDSGLHKGYDARPSFTSNTNDVLTDDTSSKSTLETTIFDSVDSLTESESLLSSTRPSPVDGGQSLEVGRAREDIGEERKSVET